MEERQVACVFQGSARVLSIIILGHTNGEERALGWQTAGDSSGPLPGWRNVTLSQVADVALLESRLQRGIRKKGEQRWVVDVDLDVNSDSPYQPRRSLAALRRQYRSK
jgi:hypothetical protein